LTYKERAMKETRFCTLTQSMPERAKALMLQGQQEAVARMRLYQALAATGTSPYASPEPAKPAT
jgi:hypothetical protein